MAEMINIPTLKHILTLAKSEGVKYLKLGEMEVTFFQSSGAAQTDLSGAVSTATETVPPAEEDMLYYSSGFQPNPEKRD